MTYGTSDDVNVTVRTAYNADGNVSSITAENSATGNQTTQFVYGTTLADSDIASSLLKREEIYPDSVGGSDKFTFTYNRQGEQTSATDQQGTVHTYDYDGLARRVQDRVTTLGTGVDGAIRRIAMAYEVRGMLQTLTSYDDPNPVQGTVVNQVAFEYNDFSQLISDAQSHAGSVDVNTPQVQYAYADGSDNTIRPTELVYPNGRELTFSYDSADSIADMASRIAAIVDDDSTHLVDYSYLGVGGPAMGVDSPFGSGFVIADYPQPNIKWTLVDLSGNGDPDTGDIYSGLDRFGRIKDNRWYNYDSEVDVDRIKYGYDRVGNRIWRQNTVAESLNAEFDELYTNDAIHRLKDLTRGLLNAQKDGITDETFAECWSLDATGNWQKYLEDTDGDGNWDLNQSRTANKVNEITDITESTGPSWITPAYNAAGNMTTIPQPADPTKSFTAIYDAWNRLVKIIDDDTTDTIAEYEYDSAKRRIVQKTYASGSLDETRHLYYTQPSQWQVIEERIESSTDPDRQFIWGLRYVDDIVLRDRDTGSNGTLDERLYGLQDANWNVTAIADGVGTVRERYAYSAYGVPLFLTPAFAHSSLSSFDFETLYCAYQFEVTAGIVHVRNRIYLPEPGIWVQRDPVGLSAGFNLYEYSSSGPTATVDPTGLQGRPIGPEMSDWFTKGQPLSDCITNNDLEWYRQRAEDSIRNNERLHKKALERGDHRKAADYKKNIDLQRSRIDKINQELSRRSQPGFLKKCLKRCLKFRLPGPPVLLIPDWLIPDPTKPPPTA